MIGTTDAIRRQEELHALLRDLAKEDGTALAVEVVADAYVERFERVYAPDFRHRYSPMYDVVVEIARGGDSDIEMFQTKLETVWGRMEEKGSDARASFFKLYDHLSLEMRRWQESDSFETKIEDIKRQLGEIEGRTSDIRERIKDAETRVMGVQREFVGILAIFAAVVISFSSGSGYILSAISAVANAPLDRLVSIVLVCGLVLANALFILMHSVGRIVGRGAWIKWWVVLLFDVGAIALIVLARCTAFFAPAYWR